VRRARGFADNRSSCHPERSKGSPMSEQESNVAIVGLRVGVGDPSLRSG